MTRRLVIAGLAAALVVVLMASLPMAADSSRQEASGQKFEFAEVKPQDTAALRDWARGWCRGWSVASLAAALKVEPTMEAVVDYLSEGLTGDARRAVVETCQRELSRNKQIQ